MSAAALLWALGQSPGSPAEKMVLIAIADAVDEEGTCELAFDAIAAFTGGTAREIEKILGLLVESGFVVDTTAGERGVRMRLPLETPVVPARTKARRSSAAEPSSRQRGARIAEDWEPGGPDCAFAREKGLDDAEIAREAVKFRNFWLSKGGRDAVKLRWDLTWRNWVMNAIERKEGRDARSAGKRKAYSC